MARKAFTVEEANALIPELERIFTELNTHLTIVRSAGDQIKILDVLWGDALHEPSNPDHSEYASHDASIRAAFQSIELLVRDEINGRGIRFPAGGLEDGLVDFPTTYSGRWVYLCWRLGERRISAWHETDGGFAGRRPLTADQARRMGREDDPRQVDDSKLDF
ncbi:MAG: DUF2203 domain-containing protein [Gemmatimonadetes bacterium]|nr:DUF2203 domain-containing protein [Gemmatimonadota bacterium]